MVRKHSVISFPGMIKNETTKKRMGRPSWKVEDTERYSTEMGDN